MFLNATSLCRNVGKVLDGIVARIESTKRHRIRREKKTFSGLKDMRGKIGNLSSSGDGDGNKLQEISFSVAWLHPYLPEAKFWSAL